MASELRPLHVNIVAQVVHDGARTVMHRGGAVTMPRWAVLNRNAMEAQIGLIRVCLDLIDSKEDLTVEKVHNRWQKVLREGGWKESGNNFDQMNLLTPFYVQFDKMKPWQTVYYDYVAASVKSLAEVIER